jgi:hypothetical protein
MAGIFNVDFKTIVRPSKSPYFRKDIENLKGIVS